MKISKKSSHILVIFFLSLIIYSLFIAQEFNSTNEISRIGTIYNLVTEHSFQIDNIPWYNLDKVLINGHYYSDKPPTLSFLHSGIYWMIYHILHLDLLDNPSLFLWVFVFLVIALISSLSLVFFYKLLNQTGFKENVCFNMTLLLAFGTLFFPFSAVYNAHIVAAHFVIFSLYLLTKKEKNIWDSVLVGVFIGLTTTIDLLVGVFFLFFMSFYFVFYVKREMKDKLIYFIIVLISGLLYLVLNYNLTGLFLPGSLQPELFSYNGSAFSDDNLTGFYNHSSFWTLCRYAFVLLIGQRGLFIYTPILIYGIFGFLKAWKSKFDKILLLCLALVILFSVIFAILFSSEYSGASFGIRWFVPLMPIFIFLVSFYYEDMKKRASKFEKYLFYLIYVVSIIIALIGAFFPWSKGLFSLIWNIDYIWNEFSDKFWNYYYLLT
ncbi:hypothetical protein COU54_05305 [Candidatus Pacearchaeota archaeon CG10_big_fil_rev_8_21_14_0_10_31_24]|nr:MAG: hypothetical protein COU54_05305 [Candidatus Pacearchaeota archaeon CG10_big_fil_rev_8_21_14_0_10_31_24]